MALRSSKLGQGAIAFGSADDQVVSFDNNMIERLWRSVK
jgi:hypothetical protein